MSVSRIEGLGKLAGQIVCEEGGPIYQGLVKEGIVKLTTWAFLQNRWYFAQMLVQISDIVRKSTLN